MRPVCTCACVRVARLRSLRALFGTDGMRNAVHVPADKAAAVGAINTLFPLGECSHALPARPHPCACAPRVTCLLGRSLEDLGSDKSSAEQPTDELVEVITAGLAELGRMKPPNPAEWLAEWMIANRDPEKRARKKLAETYAMQ